MTIIVGKTLTPNASATFKSGSNATRRIFAAVAYRLAVAIDSPPSTL